MKLPRLPGAHGGAPLLLAGPRARGAFARGLLRPEIPVALSRGVLGPGVLAALARGVLGPGVLAALARGVLGPGVLAALAFGAAAVQAGAPPDLARHPIDPPAAPGSSAPFLSADTAGTVWLSWIEPAGRDGHALRFSRLGPGRHWSAPGTVPTGDSMLANWANSPAVVPLGGGRLAAAWPRLHAAGGEAATVRVALSGNAGRTWTTPVTPHRDGTATEHGFVSLLPEGNGVRAVWLDGRKFAAEAAGAKGAAGHAHGADESPDAEMTLRTAWIGPNGAATPDESLDPRTCDCCPTAAVNTARGTLVAYRDRSPGEVRDISTLLMDGGGRAVEGKAGRAMATREGRLRDDGWMIRGCPVSGPALAAHGNFVVACWYTAAADTPRVQVAFSGDGGATFGPAARVDQGHPLGRVAVALTPGGDAMVTWIEKAASPAGAAGLMALRISPDGTRGESRALASVPNARQAGTPRLVAGRDGLVLAWVEPGTPSKLRALAWTP
ncbi:MAG: hypothetical protein HZB25_07680 [Candidatus Eisenbacteria bacterium]|nr:hypothetical protein [Candidatus Eisenbacteria bacterium]